MFISQNILTVRYKKNQAVFEDILVGRIGSKVNNFLYGAACFLSFIHDTIA